MCPPQVSAVSGGFCFPDIDSYGDEVLEEELEKDCSKSSYFAIVHALFKAEEFMFVRAETAGALTKDPNWYPLRLQLDMLYWQVEVCRSSKCSFKKQLIQVIYLYTTWIKPELFLHALT